MNERQLLEYSMCLWLICSSKTIFFYCVSFGRKDDQSKHFLQSFEIQLSFFVGILFKVISSNAKGLMIGSSSSSSRLGCNLSLFWLVWKQFGYRIISISSLMLIFTLMSSNYTFGKSRFERKFSVNFRTFSEAGQIEAS